MNPEGKITPIALAPDTEATVAEITRFAQISEEEAREQCKQMGAALAREVACIRHTACAR